MIRLAFVSLLIGLAGCAFGISHDGTDPSASFEVDSSYQEVYRRADAYPRHCLQLPDQIVTGNLYHDTRSGVVRVNSPASAKPLEEIEIKDSGASRTQVTVTVWGVGIWDEGELAAAKESIASGKPMCRSASYRKYQ
ncbi:BPTD_2524 family lipoprotein [Achromobacter xylosoxidans]